MITLSSIPEDKTGGRKKFSFEGLSSDTKPTTEYEGDKIGNGSVFLELDTMNVMMYDEDGERWV